MICTKFHKIAT